jgi:serine/threonine protein phosphatase PrpC
MEFQTVKSMKSEAQAFSYIGRVRAENEDSFLCDPENSVVAVSDGVGGIPGGALASQTAMATLRSILADDQAERDAAVWTEKMNRAVRAAGEKRGFHQAIACTLTLMSFAPGTATLAQVGDSAAFLIRGNRIERLTEIHNVESEALAKGQPVDHLGRYRFAITRCLGMKEPCVPQIRQLDTRPSDLFLLATDGLTDLIEPIEILEEYGRDTNLEVFLEALRLTSFDRGAHDNVTAVALRVDSA